MAIKDTTWGTTKTSLRKDFQHARYLMRLIENQIKNEDKISDWSEAGEFGQMINELIACASNASAYRVGREIYLNK